MKRQKSLKQKIYLCIVLPFFVAVLAVKVFRTYFHLRIRQAAQGEVKQQPVSVLKERVQAEWIIQEPAGIVQNGQNLHETITNKA